MLAFILGKSAEFPPDCLPCIMRVIRGTGNILARRRRRAKQKEKGGA